jgi:hypothetical protein
MLTVTISGNGKTETREAQSVVYHQGTPPNTAGLPDVKNHVSIYADGEPTQLVDMGRVFVMNEKGATIAVHDVIQLT